MKRVAPLVFIAAAALTGTVAWLLGGINRAIRQIGTTKP